MIDNVADDVPQEPDMLVADLLADPRRLTDAQKDEAARISGRSRSQVDADVAARAKRWLEGWDTDLATELGLYDGPATEETLARLRAGR